ncbi:uncharacterized protein LOC103580151 isoform X1 [Microplitis demolitor]|uniref:uncharacterized protein LOC103580151 isoform X1 n=1 Tax=Microplitis demolitor TaxID=69319 RepID=UPI0004CCFBBA|nr:uncharacterized protein LOC103580151 isoform X1 [Microplitis demolitor]
MYVIYPADELLRIYDNPIRRFSLTCSYTTSVQSTSPSPSSSPVTPAIEKSHHDNDCLDGEEKPKQRQLRTFKNFSDKQKNKKNSSNSTLSVTSEQCNKNSKNIRNFSISKKLNSSVSSKKKLNSPIMQNRNGEEGNNPFKDLTHATLNEPLKQHNGNALKLVQTVSDFAQEFGSAIESHAANVRRLVDEFRGRSSEARNDAGSGGMRRIWESLLRQIEADAAAQLDLAAVLQQQISRPVQEAGFYRKIQSRKVFAHREAYEQVVSKTEEKLQRARVDYKRAYGALLSINESTTSEQEQNNLKRGYFEAHNAYVLQLRATNAIAERYQFHCLPALLGEIAEVYEELSGLTCGCVTRIAEAAGERVTEQNKRYQAIVKEAQNVSAQNDLQVIAKNLASSTTPRKPPRRLFVPPSPPEQIPMEKINQVPALRDELVPTGINSQPNLDDLRREADSLTLEIGRLQDSLDALMRMQRKSAEGNLFTKAAELQEDISMKRFDLGVAHLHLAAVQAQKELFGAGDVGPPDGMSNRKMSNGSTGSTKHKWLKAFKSLKTSSPTTPPTSDKPGKGAMYHAVSTVVAMSRKNLESEGGHQWREYTYRKITPCDACGQVLRGHSRQGLRCRGCKVNAHADCINLVQPANCPSLAPKRSGGIPLLRRQRTSAPPVDETASTEHSIDATYQVLKQAGEIRGNSTNSPPTPPTGDHLSSGAAPTSRIISSHPSSSTSAPHSPQRRRERLNLRMKSLSLDSPEGTAHVRHRPRDYYQGQKDSTPPRHSDSGSINRLSPCSSGHGQPVQRQGRGAIRMSSMELPDDNDKSYSSASTSPCPSPHANNQNHLNLPGKRVLPTNNLYVVLYNFDARHRDELDLKAGYKITVIDKSEKDWWKGKCLGGRAGYFPSAYVMKIESGQKTHQVTRNLQLSDQITLLRDQIVIQVSEPVDGVAMVRCAADTRSSGHVTEEGDVRFREVLCPLKFLQEV